MRPFGLSARPEDQSFVARAIIFSLLSLILVFFMARGCGLTPQQLEDRNLLAELNAEEGAAFRAATARRPGVVSTGSGLLVEVLEFGDGPMPTQDDWLRLHYRGMHLDGREFHNTWTWDEPAVSPVERMIPGWREALTQMPVGSRLRLVVPPHLAYGMAGGGPIGPDETLIFELHVLGLEPPPPVLPEDELQKPVPGLR